MFEGLLKRTTILTAALALSACASTMDKLENIGKPPPMTEVADPTARPEYKKMSWPMPDAQPEQKQYANSLWQPGARAFFRDQRASRVGDILKVRIEINDKAEVENTSERSRNANENVAAPVVPGIKLFGLGVDVEDDQMFDISGSTTTSGEGTIEREEKIETEIAALVTQVLPNGNFVIEGSQEIRVNFEVREISVAGVIRPEDIDSSNTINSTQIAQARINYGGRGQITDIQQPRWGNQVIDVLAPF